MKYSHQDNWESQRTPLNGFGKWEHEGKSVESTWNDESRSCFSGLVTMWTYENTKTNIPKRWADEMAALQNYSHIVSLPLVLLTFIYVSSLLVGGYVEQDEISFDIFRPADESMTMKSTQVWSRNLPFWNLLPFNGGCGNHMRCTCMALAWLWTERSGTPANSGSQFDTITLRGDIVHHLPLQGGALLVYYHGAIPVDYYYLVNRVLLLKEVMVRSVVDKFLFKVWKHH